MLVQDESETQLLSRAVKDLSRRTRFPVAFGGFKSDGAIAVSAATGTRTRSLDGLIVHSHRGLGGKAMVELRPRMTADYAASNQITHDYDRHILGEGIGSLLAVPVVVGGSTRAVLYGGAWGSGAAGDVVASAAFQVAEAFGSELRIRDEVQRRLAAAPVAVPATLAPAQREELRESFAELRSIAATIDDSALRDRLASVERRLATLSNDEPTPADPAPSDVRLAPREIDVLACAAIGSTNAQIAASLGLREGTVKAYLGSAMSKLDASTRHAAVTKARRAGLLP